MTATSAHHRCYGESMWFRMSCRFQEASRGSLDLRRVRYLSPVSAADRALAAIIGDNALMRREVGQIQFDPGNLPVSMPAVCDICKRVKPFGSPEEQPRTEFTIARDNMINHIGSLSRRVLGFAGTSALLLAVTPTAAQAADYTVTLASMSYGRVPSQLKVGDTITFVNKDTVPHTVTARDKSFDLHMGPGQSAKMTTDKEGSFPFYCTYHSTMRGTLKVAAR